MVKSPPVPATAPDTVWLARGRHLGSTAGDVVRHRLSALQRDEVIDDHGEFDAPLDGLDGARRRAFEARWRVADDVVVRARLTVGPPDDKDDVRDWVLVAEADRPWDLNWPSPATMFWPEDTGVPWDHDMVAGVRFRELNPLPADDQDLKRLLRDCGRRSWSIHVVVHEAMTPDQGGRRPLATLVPAGLRHRIVEHRAAPEQFQIVNWALYNLGVRVPRGGAVVLPGTPARPGYEDHDFTVRSVFLDGSQPTELIDKVVRYAALPRPLPGWAEQALSELREKWRLFTVEEARRLMVQYAEALKTMTTSRDLYREAAESAHEALAAYQAVSADAAASGAREEPRKRERFSFRALTKPLERVGGGAKLLRRTDPDGSARDTTSSGSSGSAGSQATSDSLDSSDSQATSSQATSGSSGSSGGDMSDSGSAAGTSGSGSTEPTEPERTQAP